jgi:hypothetical protein
VADDHLPDVELVCVPQQLQQEERGRVGQRRQMGGVVMSDGLCNLTPLGGAECREEPVPADHAQGQPAVVF